MAYTTINKSGDYFNTLTWSGNGNATRSYTGVGFQPDLLWVKNRSTTSNHLWFDVIRGTNKILQSSTISAEITDPSSGYLSSFDSDGFSVQAGSSSTANFNTNSENYVAWNWLGANGTASNTDGSITSTVSANTTSGFSIVKYTGTGSNATVGHGLGVAPKMIHVKGIDVGTTNWLTGGSNISSNWSSSLHLNTTGGLDTFNYWQNQAPNANTFALSTDGANNQSSINFIAYCFAEVPGYSKFGSYTGNGSTDGPFIYTGFKPAMVIVKRTSGADRWVISDNKRDPDNPVIGELNPNDNTAEDTTSTPFDFLSNGFKLRRIGNVFNGSGETYIYMAFGQSLVGSNNVPCTAR